MTTPPLPWRKLEAEIIAVARAEGFWIEQAQTGDSFIDLTHDDRPININLTEFARALAERLGGK